MGFTEKKQEKVLFPNLVIAGLGLLGGSIALAAREQKIAGRIIALGRRDYTEAVEVGLVDECTTDFEAACAKADLMVLCTPVEIIRQQLPDVMKLIKPDAMVTDVGSTKGRLVELAEGLDETQGAFVGSHPMAGSHLTGWKSADKFLFVGRIVYITVTENSNLDAVARLGHFWEAVGSRVVFTTPERHDKLCALLSHIPHMTAAAMVNLLATSKEDPELLRHLAGPGLRDSTRIAMGSADVWTEISQHNSKEIAEGLDQLADQIKDLAGLVRDGGDDLYSYLDKVRELRQVLEGE
jgi:prephenate dehydrogenase